MNHDVSVTSGDFTAPPYKKKKPYPKKSCLLDCEGPMKVKFARIMHNFYFGGYDEFKCKHSLTHRYKDSTCVSFLTPDIKVGGSRSQGVACLWKRLRSHL